MAPEILLKDAGPRRKASETGESRAAGLASLQAERMQLNVLSSSSFRGGAGVGMSMASRLPASTRGFGFQ